MAPPAVGNQAVFSDIDVVIRASDYDAVDPDLQLSGAVSVNEPRIIGMVEALVEINGGSSEGRVPELRLFGDGFELEERGSASSLPRFSFSGRPPNATRGQIVTLEFRRDASSFFLDVQSFGVTITRPSVGQTVPSNQPLRLEWTGPSAAPQRATLTAREDGCVIVFRQTGAATFVPERDERQGGHEPPCPFQLYAEWLDQAPTPPSPFRSLRIERMAGRIQRFVVG